METTPIRYKFNPNLTDTVGFFDYSIPLTNESSPPVADTLKKYQDFSVYNFVTPPAAPKSLPKPPRYFKNISYPR